MIHFEKDNIDYHISEEKNSLPLKRLLFQIVQMWPWFLVSITVCSVLAYLYLERARPVYKAVSSLMVKDDSKGWSNTEATRLKEIGLNTESKSVANEIEVLKSYDLVGKVVDSLDLNVDISLKKDGKSIAVFGGEIPFSLVFKNSRDISRASKWNIESDENRATLHSETSGKSLKLENGKQYNIDGAVFHFSTHGRGQADVKKGAKLFKVNISPFNNAVLQYDNRLVATPANKLGTVINLEITDVNRHKCKAFLETLVSLYSQQDLEFRNRTAENTINFLTDRIKEVSGELTDMQARVAGFKKENKLTSLSSDADNYLQTSQKVDIQKAEALTQLNLINALEATLKANINKTNVIPSTYLQSQSLNDLIKRYNDLILQRDQLRQIAGDKNPLLSEQDVQIDKLSQIISSNIANLKKEYTIALQNISQQDSELKQRLHSVPQSEQNLLEITRNQNVQQNLYAYLLQKKEEASVAIESNLQDFQTVVRAHDLGVVSPKKPLVYGAGLILGLILPVTLFGIKNLRNNKIGDVHQIEQHTTLPLLGVLTHVKRLRNPVIVEKQSRSAAAEQIRNVRSAITTRKNAKGARTILVTSFQLGDGKSFTSLNLAASFALLRQKVVILEFDLRRPGIAKKLGIENREGICDILEGRSDFRDVLVTIDGYDDNLFLIPAGNSYSNPAELISTRAMRDLMDNLKKQFDVVLIDTPPFTLVADTLLLVKHADLALIVLRQAHTSREVYSALQHLPSKWPEIPVYLVLNDVGKLKKYRYEYGYGGYGYNPGQKYYESQRR